MERDDEKKWRNRYVPLSLILECLTIEEILPIVMKQSEKIGGFSLDLYYDDFAKPGEDYVAKIKFCNDGLPDFHSRMPNFHSALESGIEYIDDLGGNTYKDLLLFIINKVKQE